MGDSRSRSGEDAPVVLDAMNRPRLREAIRASLFGWGGTSWMSRRRQKLVRWMLPVSGFVLGVCVMWIEGRLPPGTLRWQELLVLGIATLALLTIYFVYDVVVSLEMLEKRAVQADLQLARQIQKRMLPENLPRLEGWEFAAHHESARSIGGDSYDVRELDDGRLLLVVTDVAGKGAAAALLSMGVLARLRALARTGMDVDELTVRLSAALVEETEPEHFATLVVAELDPRTGEVVYVNAGNVPPLLVRANGTIEMLTAGGLPVGMLPEAEYEESRIVLDSGDRLVIATDGLYDADEFGGVLWSEEELGARWVASRDQPIEEVVASVVREVHVRSGSNRFDDLTLLAVGRRRAAD